MVDRKPRVIAAVIAFAMLPTLVAAQHPDLEALLADTDDLWQGDAACYIEQQCSWGDFHHWVQTVIAAGGLDVIDRHVNVGDPSYYSGPLRSWEIPNLTEYIATQLTGERWPLYPTGTEGVDRWRPMVTHAFRVQGLEHLVSQALQVMWCESRGDPGAANPSSSASGLMQFLSSTWRSASSQTPGYEDSSVWDPQAHLAVTAWLVRDSISKSIGPWSHWRASKHCHGL